MRVLPPKDEDRFIGKNTTPDVIMDYIGSHRVLFTDKVETTIKDFVKDSNYFNQHSMHLFHTLFPLESQDLARAYIHYALNCEEL